MPVQQVDLGYRPHKFQTKIHLGAKRFTVVVAHRRFGKTVAAVATLMDAAIRTQKPNARFGYVAPFLGQAKRVAWDYFKDYARKIPYTEISEGNLSISFPNGARITLYGADNPDSMRGVYFDGVVLDEMADFRPDVWGGIIRPQLSDRKGWALFIGTPKGVNQFSEMYHTALTGTDPEWAAFMFRVDETNIISDAELKSSRSTMSESQYRQEWLCDFNASTDNTLITIDLASAAASRVLTESDIRGMPRIIGVDVARFGDDRSCIQKRQGLLAYEPIIFNDIDNMALAARLVSVINDWSPDAVFIDAGRGEGVIDRVRQLGYSAIEVNFGGRPDDNSYVNKRSEMWDQMKRWLEAGAKIPNNVALKTDLCVPTFSYDAANRFVLESKDAIRKRGMRSPDLGDSLCLTFSHKIAPKMLGPQTSVRQPVNAIRDYDPFASMNTGGNAMQDYDPWR